MSDYDQASRTSFWLSRLRRGSAVLRELGQVRIAIAMCDGLIGKGMRFEGLGFTCLRVVYRRLLLRSLTCTSGSLLAPTSYYYAYSEWRLAAGMSGRSRELRF